MTRPEGISESAWTAASTHAIKYVDWIGRPKVDADAEHVLTVTIARAIQAAQEAEREALSIAVGKFLMLKTSVPVVRIVECEELIRKGA